MTNMNSFNLKEHELTVEEVFRNLSPSTLYEHAILYDKDAHIAENGALVAYSGVKTGRSPKDKRVVNQSPSKDEVWCDSRDLDESMVVEDRDVVLVPRRYYPVVSHGYESYSSSLGRS